LPFLAESSKHELLFVRLAAGLVVSSTRGCSDFC
jgi:hypothetical protein